MSKIKPKIKNLVLSGGGSKGFTYFGVYQALTELDSKFLDHLSSLAGTSAGAIVVTLIALRYSPNELYSFITSFDYNRLKSWDFLNVFVNQGLETGENILIFLKKIISHKINNTSTNNPTFQDLYNYHPYTLNIVVTHLNTYQAKIYNHHNTPDYPVAQAIRESISMPMMLTPIKVPKLNECEDEGLSKDYYVDGGLINNFPIDLYPDDPSTLGVVVENTQDRYEINNNEDYIYHVMMCGYNQVTKKKIREYSKTQILKINTEEISMTHFDLPFHLRKKLYQIGYHTTLDFFNASHDPFPESPDESS